MTDLARALWGIPVILQAERDSVFPTPERDQRYQDRTTGDVYRYDGSSWALDLLGGKGSVLDVRAFGAVGDGVTDDTAAIQAALDAVKITGGTVYLPPGEYKVTAALDLTCATSSTVAITIQGSAFRATQLNAQHTGHVFDCTGRAFLTFKDFSVSGNAVTTPKTAFLLARNTTQASAGNHVFENIHTLGTFSVAALYGYASEIVRARDCQFTNSVTGKPVILFTQSNISAQASAFVTIATGVISNTVFAFDGCEVNNYAASGNNDCVYLEGVSSFSYRGGFMYTTDGRAFVFIDASVAASANVAIRDTMWDGGATFYGVTVSGTFEVTRLTLDNVYDTGVKAFAGTVTAPTGGITVYGQDNSVISDLHLTNVYSTAALYYRLYQCTDSTLALGSADRLYWKYACSGNRVAVAATKLTIARPDLATGNMVHFLDTGTVSNVRQSLDNGDASKVVAATDAPTQRFDSTLSANRTVTLPANSASAIGQRFRIVRTGLGAFTLTVQDATPTTLKVMPSATAAFVDVEFNGTAWKLAGYGTL